MLMTTNTLESLVEEAVEGSAEALDAVVRAIKDDVYGIAIRMLWHPADAEDATQEILIRVIANLGTFEGRSKFRTWVYRVAVRALLNMKRGRAEAPLSFDEFGADLADGLTDDAPDDMPDAERVVLAREVKIGCTQAMLLCLDRDHRIAYVLGEILQLTSEEAVACLDVPSATYRKRLSRARRRVEDFTAAHCGLVSERAACRCRRRITPALAAGRIDPERLLFAKRPASTTTLEETEAVIGALEATCNTPTLMRSNPRYEAPASVLATIAKYVATGASSGTSDTPLEP